MSSSRVEISKCSRVLLHICKIISVRNDSEINRTRQLLTIRELMNTGTNDLSHSKQKNKTINRCKAIDSDPANTPRDKTCQQKVDNVKEVFKIEKSLALCNVRKKTSGIFWKTKPWKLQLPIDAHVIHIQQLANTILNYLSYTRARIHINTNTYYTYSVKFT